MARGVVSLHCAYLQSGSLLLGEKELTWSSVWDPLDKRGVWGAGPPQHERAHGLIPLIRRAEDFCCFSRPVTIKSGFLRNKLLALSFLLRFLLEFEITLAVTVFFIPL